MKTFPLKKKALITEDSMSFINVDFNIYTEIPIGNHVGAFGYTRKNHKHEGVDLYCNPGDEVFAMEDGEVVNIEWFTGENANPPSPWWRNTRAIHVEGESGVIVYGEINELDNIKIGTRIKQGQCIGFVNTVLVKNKGRPMTMLHLELYEHGTRESVVWHPWQDAKPKFLKDPTNLLINAINK